MNLALFLDRDGVINIEKNHLYKIDDFEFIDGVFEACRYFQDKGYLLIVVTNQSGIARGLYTEKDFNILTDWMIDEFSDNNIKISRVLYCPHHPEFSGACLCRKPNPGMLYQAAEEFNIDLANSILVGDKKSDMLAAKSAGIVSRILVHTGHDISKTDEQEASLVLKTLGELKDYYG